MRQSDVKRKKKKKKPTVSRQPTLIRMTAESFFELHKPFRHHNVLFCQEKLLGSTFVRTLVIFKISAKLLLLLLNHCCYYRHYSLQCYQYYNSLYKNWPSVFSEVKVTMHLPFIYTLWLLFSFSAHTHWPLHTHCHPAGWQCAEWAVP